MSVRVNVRMSQIICTLKKIGVRTYATYANCQTLPLRSNHKKQTNQIR